MISLKHLGALAVVILMLGLIYVVQRWGRGQHATFSQHVAPYKSAVIFYNGLFTVVLPLLIVFFAGWFVPTYHLTFWFTVSVILAAIFQYVATIIPETGGWKTDAHRFLAGCSAVLLLPPLVFLLFSDSTSIISQIITVISLLTMIAIIALVSIRHANNPRILLLQSSYFAAFFAAIMTATYL